MKTDVLEKIKSICNYEYHDVALVDKKAEFPHSTWDKFTDAGLFEICNSYVETNKLKPVDLIHIMENLGYFSEDNGLNFSVVAHSFACQLPLLKFDTENKFQKELLAAKKGKLISHAITEANAGSDAFKMSSKAVHKNRKITLTGSKTFCSNCPNAEFVLFYASCNKQVNAYLLRKNEFKLGRHIQKLGLRSATMAEFEVEIELDRDALVGEVGSGFAMFLYAMDWERVAMSAVQVGTMQRLLDNYKIWLKSKKSALSNNKDQFYFFELADMQTKVEACKMMVYRAASMLDHKRAVNKYAAMCKLLVSENYVKLTNVLSGLNIYKDTDADLERHFRDSIASKIYSGTSEIQKKIISSWL